MPWEHLTSLGDIPPGTGREFTVRDRIIALFHTDQGFFAIDGMCAHAGGPLAKGTLAGNIVTCPWHGWQYDVSSGRHCLNPIICQQSYPVKLESDQVYVDVP